MDRGEYQRKGFLYYFNGLIWTVRFLILLLFLFLVRAFVFHFTFIRFIHQFISTFYICLYSFLSIYFYILFLSSSFLFSSQNHVFFTSLRIISYFFILSFSLNPFFAHSIFFFFLPPPLPPPLNPSGGSYWTSQTESMCFLMKLMSPLFYPRH